MSGRLRPRDITGVDFDLGDSLVVVADEDGSKVAGGEKARYPLLLVAKIGTSTTGASHVALTQETPISEAVYTAASRLMFSWGYAGTKTANWELYDSVAAAVIATGTRAGSFVAQAEELTPTFTMPTNFSLLSIRCWESGAGGAGNINIVSEVILVVSP